MVTVWGRPLCGAGAGADQNLGIHSGETGRGTAGRIKEDENRRKGEMVLIAEGAKPVQDEEFSPKFCVHWRLCRKNCRRKSGCGGGGTVRREEKCSLPLHPGRGFCRRVMPFPPSGLPGGVILYISGKAAYNPQRSQPGNRCFIVVPPGDG